MVATVVVERETGSTMETTGTVFVVDDDPAVRKSLTRLMEQVELPVKDYRNAQEFLQSYTPESPGCLVLDVRMPGMSGLELHRELIQRKWHIPVLFLTAHGDVPMAVDALKRGAFDFIEKPLRGQLLIDTIRRALVCDVEQRANADRQGAIEERFALLTPREMEVVRMVVDGKNNKAIAGELGVSPQAIDARRSRAMAKLKVESIAELVRLVVERGKVCEPH